MHFPNTMRISETYSKYINLQLCKVVRGKNATYIFAFGKTIMVCEVHNFNLRNILYAEVLSSYKNEII